MQEEVERPCNTICEDERSAKQEVIECSGLCWAREGRR